MKTKHKYYQGLEIKASEPIDERFYVNGLTSEELQRVFGHDGRYGFDKSFVFDKSINNFRYLNTFIAKSDVINISNWSKIDTSTDFQSTLENGNTTSQSFYYLAEFPEGDNYKSGIFSIDGLTFPINGSSMKINNQSVTVGFAISANGGFIVKNEGTINSYLEFNLPNKPNPDYPESNKYTLATLDDLNTSSVVIAISITKTEIDALISTNSLIVGALYEISGVHPTLYNDGLNSGTTIYLQAITNNKLASQGHGLFYNPKYDKVVSGFGIWSNNMNGSFSNVVGKFDYLNKEIVTANNGATGLILASGFIQWVSGDWSAAVSITGNTSLSTASVVDFTSPIYVIDQNVIWGGYSWSNTTGNVGSSTDVLNLDTTNWIKNVYDEVNYNKVFDLIEYDYENDWIYKRSNKDGINVEYSFDVKESLGKIYSSISTIQWGNGYIQNEDEIYFSFNNIVKNAYVEDVNFSGYGNYNNTYLQCSQSYNNVYCPNSYNYNNTYEQSSRNYDNTYGSWVYNNANTYQTESMNYGNVHGENSAIYRNIYGRGSYNYNNIYDKDSTNNDNDQISSSHDNIYGQNSRFFNNIYDVGSLHYGNFYDENSSINDNIYSQASYNYDNIYGKNSHHHENTYDHGSRNYGNTYDQNSLHHGNRYGKGSYCSNNTYGSFYFKNIEIEQNVRLQNIIFSGSAILSSDYSKTIYRRPDGENRLRYYNNSDTLVIANITD